VAGSAAAMSFEELKALLPQRFPFLMIDRVVSIEEGRRIVALKNVTGNEMFFLGHFPEMAVMPREVRVVKTISSGGIVEATAWVDGEMVSRAELSFGVRRIDRASSL
jgi:3-hydroxyacyl-[acyl-carrier-protein] dehydratase